MNQNYIGSEIQKVGYKKLKKAENGQNSSNKTLEQVSIINNL